MIVVRNTFHIRAGQMKKAVELTTKGRGTFAKMGLPSPRTFVDVASEFYTLVIENEYASLDAFEKQMGQIFNDPDWQDWYQQLTPLVRNGRREIFRSVD
jgi:hypothetical protein